MSRTTCIARPLPPQARVAWPPLTASAIWNLSGIKPMHYIIAHYHELALKGRNRPMLVDRLVRNIREGLRGLGRCHVESLAGRIRIGIEDPGRWATAKTRIECTFGLANFAPAHHVSSELETMTAAI